MKKNEGEKSDNSSIAIKKSPLQKVGEFLKEARQGRNLSLDDLSSSLRIGKEQLIALEEGNERSLPEKVFIRAMVRRIAEKLNLDTSFILEELNDKKKEDLNLTPFKKQENKKTNKKLNPFGLIFLSGFFGLASSILFLSYIEENKNDSTNLPKSELYNFEKNT